MSTESSKPTPNDQRADVNNPNNPAHKDAQDNRSEQLDPKNPKHQPQQGAPPGPAKKS
jgi:hypothetical protein